MKCKVEKDVFLGILEKMQAVAGRKNSMPILLNVLIKVKDGSVELMATDLEVFIKDSCSTLVGENGDVAVNAKKLFEICKEAPEKTLDVSSGENNKVTIRSGKATFSILSFAPTEFPSFPAIAEDGFFKASAEVLSSMIGKTVFAAGTTDSRNAMNGVFWQSADGKVSMVTTDGHRMSVIQRNGERKELSQGILLPKKGALELVKFLDSTEGDTFLGFSENSIIAKRGAATMVIRLLDAQFPDYRKAIPQEGSDKVVKIKKEDFWGLLRRVSLLSPEGGKNVKFSLSEGKIEVSSKNPTLGEAREELSVDYKGEVLEIGFNASYIMEALDVMSGDEIVIKFKSPVEPAVLRSSTDEAHLYVVMPMNLAA